MQISWKYDNRESVVVTDASSNSAAWDAATDFVQAAGTEYAISMAQMEAEDSKDDRYEFRVKTY